MPFIGNKPSAVPLTSADIADSIITSAKITDATIVNGDIANSTIALAKLSATGTASASTFLRGDNSWVAAGGANTPAFHAYKTLSQDQSMSQATWTKISLQVELFDTNSNFDSTTNYRFTPTTAGKYFIYGTVLHNFGGSYATSYKVSIYKNGSGLPQFIRQYYGVPNGTGGEVCSLDISSIISLNGSTDYVELYAYQNSTVPSITQDGVGGQVFFGGYKIIE
jgi:hypothetical protein